MALSSSSKKSTQGDSDSDSDEEVLRTGASEDRWMVAPGYDELLTTWCGLTLG
jgi:hypothetical protein